MDKDRLNLIKSAIEGSKEALSSVIKNEENNIYSTLFYLKKDDEDISDIMQNVLLKLATRIKTLKNPQYFKTWLNRIIINSYYDYLRKTRKNSNNIDIAPISNDIKDNSINPWDSILQKELDNIIKKSINNLPNHYKIPITLREIQGLSYEDISNITNISIGTVKSRIARARGIIKNEIDKYTKN